MGCFFDVLQGGHLMKKKFVTLFMALEPVFNKHNAAWKR